MDATRIVRLLVLLGAGGLLGCGLTGADGGRGSGGFDFRENAIIDKVLSSQVCVNGQRLVFCPADQRSVATSTPTPIATAPTPTPPTGPTATPEMRVDTQVAAGASVVCTRNTLSDPCELTFSFAGAGFPSGALFRVASRLREPDGAWTMAAPPTVDTTVDPPMFDTLVRLQLPAGASPQVQFAVLVFLAPPASIPEHFESLGQSGTDFAFVTAAFALEAITIGPPPTETATAESPTATATPVGPTPTATPDLPVTGPVITYFGVARADSYSLAPSAFDPMGRPIYVRPFGFALSLIVEGKPGTSRRPMGASAYSTTGAPDLQLILSRPLGDGSAAVCDRLPPDIGGVPAVVPFAFSDEASAVDAMNDVGCRVDDGQGNPTARPASAACTLNRFGEYDFVSYDTTSQFCLPIAAQWGFPPGDTIVAARLRDSGGNLGAAREIVVRNASSVDATPTPTAPSGPTDSPPPTTTHPADTPTTVPSATAIPATDTPTSDGSTPTPTPTATPSPSGAGPQISYLGVTTADNAPLTPASTDALGRPIYESLLGHGLYLIVEARPGEDRLTIGRSAFSDVGLPDFQIIVSRPLGDGSTAVCDAEPPLIGGVPATVPFGFADADANADIINDLGCRADDGAGLPVARPSSQLACTRTDASFGYGFVDATTTAQLCLLIAKPWAFAEGDTIVAARGRDVSGRVGPSHEMVVRVGH